MMSIGYIACGVHLCNKIQYLCFQAKPEIRVILQTPSSRLRHRFELCAPERASETPGCSGLPDKSHEIPQSETPEHKSCFLYPSQQGNSSNGRVQHSQHHTKGLGCTGKEVQDDEGRMGGKRNCFKKHMKQHKIHPG